MNTVLIKAPEKLTNLWFSQNAVFRHCLLLRTALQLMLVWQTLPTHAIFCEAREAVGTMYRHFGTR